MKEDGDGTAAHLEGVEVGFRVKLDPFVGFELFKEDLVSVEGCLSPDGEVVQAHGPIIRLSGVSYFPSAAGVEARRTLRWLIA